ncbi:hypothetical protein UlMin_018366 [Ulmus minor]
MFVLFQKEYLDVILVPAGLLVIFGYHLFLLHKYLHQPLRTAMGCENKDKKVWVDRIMQADKKEVQTALSVISSSISASIYLATISLTLCSLIGAWIANSRNNFVPNEIIYGDTRPIIISIKYICLLSSFLLAFSFFVQSARRFVHVNYLISTPDRGTIYLKSKVEKQVTRGGEFWSLGLRALYLALSLLLWFFGPIPMFASSIFLVIIFYLHDLEKLEGDQKGGYLVRV